MFVREPFPLIDPTRRFALFTNAKCGGTTIKHWFVSSPTLLAVMVSPRGAIGAYQRHVVSKTYLKLLRDLARYRRQPTDNTVRRLIRQHRVLTSKTIGDANGFEGYRNFLVTRNPFSRAPSAFVDKFCGDDRDKPWVRKVIEACGAESPTFLDFLDYVSRTPDDALNEHWRRQTYIIDDVDDVTWLPLESLAEAMKQNNAVWGDRDASILTARTQANVYEANSDDIDVPRMTAKELLAFKETYGAFPRKSDFLTPEVKDRIRDIYSKDFDRLPYSRDQ